MIEIVYEWRLQKIIDGKKATQNYGVRVISHTNLFNKNNRKCTVEICKVQRLKKADILHKDNFRSFAVRQANPIIIPSNPDNVVIVAMILRGNTHLTC